MSEILGKIEKPEATQFQSGRKLFFVPLIITPPEENEHIANLANKYWNEATEQIRNLEAKLSPIKRIYHELLPNRENLQQLKVMNVGSYSIMKAFMADDIVINEIEDSELMREFLDWNLCLSLQLQSQKVFNKVYEAFQEITQKRNEHIAKRIDETLENDESAVLFMREGHHVQFSSDIQIFYIAPPTLDTLKRALHEQQANILKREQEDNNHEHHKEAAS